MKIYAFIVAFVIGGTCPMFGSDVSQLDAALISNDQKKAIALFQNGVPVDGDMSNGTPFILEATRRSLFEVVSYLIASGADMTRRDKEGRTALHVATESKADKIVPILLSTKAFNINMPDKEGFTPLLYASTNCPEIVDLLIRAGADPNLSSSDSYKITPLEWAADRGVYFTIPTLIKGGAKVQGEAGSRAVKWASSYDTDDHAKAILALAKAGANIDGEPIWGALENNRKKCLAALLEGGANVNQRGSNEMTPLVYASRDGDIGLVKIVLGYHPDLELKARFPFAFHGFPDIPIEERYNDRTALMCAAQSGRLDLVKLLIQAGANPATKDRNGLTALEIAKQGRKKEIVDYLATK